MQELLGMQVVHYRIQDLFWILKMNTIPLNLPFDAVGVAGFHDWAEVLTHTVDFIR